MKSPGWPAVLGVACAVVGVAAAQFGADDTTKLDGKWVVASTSRDAVLAAPWKGSQWVFAGSMTTVKWPSGREQTFTVTSDPVKMPKAMDFTPPKKSAETHWPMIYELVGDSLKLCIGSGDKRPAKFTDKDGLIVVLKREPAEAKSARQEPRYTAYWLTKPGGNNEYRMLLITRTPLAELAKLMKRHAELENVLKDTSPPQLLEQWALTIATYKKDSIWNDGIPLRPLTRFKELNDKDRTVEVSGVLHNYEECPLADVVRLLKNPVGTERISRIHSPLGGMEQTARARRLLLEDQMKDDEPKKK